MAIFKFYKIFYEIFSKYDFSDNVDLSNWDVSSVTSFEKMFKNTNYNKPLKNWNINITGNYVNMSNMFNECSFNQDISNWNVSNVTNFERMFKNSFCYNQPIKDWSLNTTNDISISMSGMFAKTCFNQYLNWDVSNVVNFKNMFTDSSFNIDISNVIKKISINLANRTEPEPTLNMFKGTQIVIDASDINNSMYNAFTEINFYHANSGNLFDGSSYARDASLIAPQSS